MTFLPLQLPPGIVRGANPDDFPGRWFDGSLVRWREGVMEPVGGWSKITTTALGSTPRKIAQWRRNNGALMTVVACDAHLYADNSGTYTNVAPGDLQALNSATGLGYGTTSYGTGAYGTARSGTSTLTIIPGAWTLANWGEDLLATASTDGRLFYYSSGSPGATVAVVGVYSISSISRTSNVTTVTTSGPHYLSSGESVKIAGVSNATFNVGNVTVTVTGSTTFTYANTGTDGSSTGGTVTDLSVPANVRSVNVTPERHVMILRSGSREVAWSSREDFRDWNFASTTNTAGFLPLQSETPLVSQCNVREGTLVWSGNRVFIMRYVGLPFVYGSDELGSTKIYSPNTYAEFDGKCVWMDASGFSIYEGGSVRPLQCPLTDYVFSNIDPNFGPLKAHAVNNSKFDEVWFFYPSVGQTECDRYIVWNWSENWWSMGVLARTAAHPATINGYPLMGGPDNHLYQHETGWEYSGLDVPGSIYVTSSTINMPDNESNLTINQVIPSNGSSYDLTNYTFYTRLTPGGAERTFGPYNARSDGYVDTRVSGRDVRIKIASNGEGDWSIGRLRLKVGSSGGRR